MLFLGQNSFRHKTSISTVTYIYTCNPVVYMTIAANPYNEVERLSALYEYNILDTAAEAEYDDITRIAKEICDASGSLIGLIDSNRQWYKSKSKTGVGGEQVERDISFCSHAILKPDEIMVVPDPREDSRFFDHPYVIAEADPVLFYAGVPLVTPRGYALGTLCIIDTKPKQLTASQKETLLALSRQVVAYMEVRKVNQALEKQKAELEELNKELERFSYVVAHDIKSPVSSLLMATDFLRDIAGKGLPEEAHDMINMMSDASNGIVQMVDGILKHTKTVNKEEIVKERFTFGVFIADLRKMLNIPDKFTFTIDGNNRELYTSKHMLMQIMLNLCSNAIKYNDKLEGRLVVQLEETATHYRFSVSDNGRGIDTGNHSAVFDLFTTVGAPNRNNEKGHGIGLATVKRLVQKMGGEIELESTLGEGSTFTFTIHK